VAVIFAGIVINPAIIRRTVSSSRRGFTIQQCQY
jgi:hypothetical protein